MRCASIVGDVAAAFEKNQIAFLSTLKQDDTGNRAAGAQVPIVTKRSEIII